MTHHTNPIPGSTEDALDLLERVDPDRHAEIGAHSPVAWLAQLVLTYRKERGVSQKALALALGSTQPTISRLESGEIDPTFSRACEALGALGHRLVAIPLSDEPFVLASQSEFRAIVEQEIAERTEQINKAAISNALVRLADVGIGSYDTAPGTHAAVPRKARYSAE